MGKEGFDKQLKIFYIMRCTGVLRVADKLGPKCSM